MLPMLLCFSELSFSVLGLYILLIITDLASLMVMTAFTLYNTQTNYCIVLETFALTAGSDIMSLVPIFPKANGNCLKILKLCHWRNVTMFWMGFGEITRKCLGYIRGWKVFCVVKFDVIGDVRTIPLSARND